MQDALLLSHALLCPPPAPASPRQDLRSQERCQLHDVYLRLQDTAQRLDAHYRAAAADAADHTRMAGEAEAAALLACDRGPQVGSAARRCRRCNSFIASQCSWQTRPCK